MAASSSDPALCVFFDIDGTLISGKANRVHHNSFEEAVLEVTGKRPDLDSIPHHGSTDRLILRALLENINHPTDKIDADVERCAEAMVAFCDKHLLSGPEITLLPGVLEILEALHERKIPIGLVTGNLEKIAYWKMERASVPLHYFSAGGFGSDHTERSEMIKIALQRIEEKNKCKYTKVWHVGDTPKDVNAANVAGVKCVAVTTGKFTQSDLGGLGAAHVLDSMANTPNMLDIFGLK